MWLWVKITLLCLIPFCDAFGQMKEYFSLKNNDRFDKLDLTLTATSGTCLIQPSRYHEVISIYGFENQDTFNPNFESKMVDRVHVINFDVQNLQQGGMGKVLSSRIFGANPCRNNNWNIYLSDLKPLNLNLNYVVGEAEVDLSGLPVENLKITTGNAKVRIGYASELYNPVEMDSFFVKVDMGSLHVHQLNLSKAREIVAEVGVGKLFLDFSNPHIICQSNVSAKVGAGSMEIYLSEKETPILIKVNNSPLCHIKMPRSFKRIGKDIYANDLYSPGADHLISFDLDVALGHITFISK
jgi:hypothetical protein